MIASVGKKLLPSRSQLWVVCVAVLPLIPGTVLGSDILEQKFEGIVVPRLWVQVVPQVDGVISRILVAPGQRVSKGDILFEMDPEAFAIDVRIAQSELAERITATRALYLSIYNDGQAVTNLLDFVPQAVGGLAMTVKIDGVEPNIFPDVEDLDARDAGRNVEVFLDVRVDGKPTPVTVKLSYEQASDLATLLEPFRKS